MKKLTKVVILAILAITVVSCKKQTPPAPQPEEPVKQAPAAPKTAEQVPAQAVQPAAQQKLEPIPLVLPKPQFVGTPENIEGVDKLEKPLGKLRPPFLAPQGTTNVAFKKPVTGSESEPIMGTLDMITDGDKEANDACVVEMGPFTQWVQVNLEQECDIYAIVLWHFHKNARVYFDTIVQVSNDPDFITDVKTIFNNDIDNSSGQGLGENMNYVETNEGKLIDAKGIKGRYVRCFSNGNNSNDLNHYIEIEVYGKKAQ